MVYSIYTAELLSLIRSLLIVLNAYIFFLFMAWHKPFLVHTQTYFSHPSTTEQHCWLVTPAEPHTHTGSKDCWPTTPTAVLPVSILC